MNLELKIIEFENKYKQKYKDFDEKKIRKYTNNKMKKEIKEFIKLNLEPTLTLFNSDLYTKNRIML